MPGNKRRLDASSKEEAQKIPKNIHITDNFVTTVSRLFPTQPYALPNDIGRLVAGFLPAYAFHRLPEVSKLWFNESKQNLLFKPNLSKIAASAETPQDAINILLDINLRDQLTINELFKIISLHPTLASAVVTEFGKELNDLPGSFLGLLGTHLEEVALQIVEMSNKGVFLSGATLTMLGKAHQNVAMTILNSEKLSTILTNQGILAIASSHLHVAEYIYSNKPKHLVQKIKTKEIIELAKLNKSVAKQLLNNEKICERITDASFYLFTYPELKDEVLTHPILKNKIKFEILINDLSTAIAMNCATKEQIILTKALLQDTTKEFNVSPSAVCSLAGYDVEFAKIIFNNKKWFDKCNNIEKQDIIDKYTHNIVKTWPQDKKTPHIDTLKNEKNIIVYSYALHNETNAVAVLANKDIRVKLYKNQIKMIGNKYSKAAHAIIELLPDNIELLCSFSKHESIASLILEKIMLGTLSIEVIPYQTICDLTTFPKLHQKILESKKIVTYLAKVQPHMIKHRKLLHEILDCNAFANNLLKMNSQILDRLALRSVQKIAATPKLEFRKSEEPKVELTLKILASVFHHVESTRLNPQQLLEIKEEVSLQPR